MLADFKHNLGFVYKSKIVTFTQPLLTDIRFNSTQKKSNFRKKNIDLGPQKRLI